MGEINKQYIPGLSILFKYCSMALSLQNSKEELWIWLLGVHVTSRGCKYDANSLTTRCIGMSFLLFSDAVITIFLIVWVIFILEGFEGFDRVVSDLSLTSAVL